MMKLHEKISKTYLSSFLKNFVFSVSSLLGRSPSQTLKMKSQDVSEFDNIYCNFQVLRHLKWNLFCENLQSLMYQGGKFQVLNLCPAPGHDQYFGISIEIILTIWTELRCQLLLSRISQRGKLLDLQVFIIICVKRGFFSISTYNCQQLAGSKANNTLTHKSLKVFTAEFPFQRSTNFLYFIFHFLQGEEI